jgi:predicted HicB family RNase H-like nuclease
VFVAARKQLARWITVGGLVVRVVGLVGFNQVQSYTRSVVSKKVDKVADGQVRHRLVTEGRKQVAEMARQQRASMAAYANQRINQLVG